MELWGVAGPLRVLSDEGAGDVAGKQGPGQKGPGSVCGEDAGREALSGRKVSPREGGQKGLGRWMLVPRQPVGDPRA